MSVLVKKMKFPKSCRECRFCITCYDCEGYDNFCAASVDENGSCRGLGETPETPTDRRMEWCPLVEIDSKIFDKEETALDAFDEQFDRAAQSAALGVRYEEGEDAVSSERSS